MAKILIVGDAHFSEHLGYYHVISDGREAERQEVLDFIIKKFNDSQCDKVVFLGDQFDKKNNPSPVIRSFTEFIERFDGKPIYLIAGNHEKTPAGDSALDYLKEIKSKNWHVITNSVEKIDNMVFCPYFFKAELEEVNGLGTRQVLQKLNEYKDKEKNILFVHFAISDSITPSNQNVNIFDEIVLPRETLEAYFLRVFGGHIHKPQTYGKVTVAGSVYNEQINESQKYIYIYDTDNNELQTIALPGRQISSVNNPSIESLEKMDTHSIIKVFISSREVDIDTIKETLKRFDGYVLVEQYPNERRSVTNSQESIDLTIENLLLIYAKQKKIDGKILLEAWNKIK